MNNFLRLGVFDELDKSQNVLVAGAGGGFDVFSGLPLYFALKNAGKNVHLANLTFADIIGSTGRKLHPQLVEITADTLGNQRYFPELHLSRWFRGRGEEVPIYAFELSGVQPIHEAYEVLVERLELDTIVLVDGGTDSLMRGDEAGLGTPVEDMASIMAVHQLDIPRKLLCCVGFGVDAFHGVCHAQFLEAVGDITRAGGFLGMWSLTREMPEVELFKSAAEQVFRKMPHHPSIVSSSILSAIEGHFGDYHSTHRTQSSRLFINALMTLMWCFQLDIVANRVLYKSAILQSQTKFDIQQEIELFRLKTRRKPYEDLPM
ncbi:MAG TPA: DUF1152 domain-containing protein [Abditibacteriaceae bacterium]|nr:DUF1152 domain-containing protein [Abditibacteriaceae bacterium]